MKVPTHEAGELTVQSLRADVALQLARHIRKLGITQLQAAQLLQLPQPTVSKIANARVADLSLELLVRVAVRAGLLLTLQTGRAYQEAGAFVSSVATHTRKRARSSIADRVRDDANDTVARLSPLERIEAFVEHNRLMGDIQQATFTRNAGPNRSGS
jgi:predicted XRE-type DNA-binding protein